MKKSKGLSGNELGGELAATRKVKLYIPVVSTRRSQRHALP